MEVIMQNIGAKAYELAIGDGAIIVLGAFLLGQLVKVFDKLPNKFIPLLCAVLGAILAVAIPAIMPGSDVATKLIMGAFLGWAATGGVETVKRLKAG